MTSARVTVTLRQSVHVGTGPLPDYRNPTHLHIPGSVLRGACAAAWIRRFGVPEPGTRHRAAFLDVFEGDGVFGPLHAPGGLPEPISMLKHKYRPSPGCVRLWWDRSRGETAEQCDVCQQRLEPAKGHIDGDSVVLARRARAALDTEGVAIDQQLFRKDVLRPGQQLTGWVAGTALHAFESVDTLWLGGSRSTGGTATVEIDPDAQPELLERDGSRLILRLASPGIFVDVAGLPTDTPDTTELAAALGVGRVTIDPHARWTRWVEAAGWHAAAGLAKPTERVVGPGSTYVVECDTVPSDDAVRGLAVSGIGLRRREGFGALCPPLAAPTGAMVA